MQVRLHKGKVLLRELWRSQEGNTLADQLSHSREETIKARERTSRKEWTEQSQSSFIGIVMFPIARV